jgi:signal transduction histidine kinase
MEMVDRLERMTTETLDFARGGGRLARRSMLLRLFLEGLAADIEEEFPGLSVHRRLGDLPGDARGALDADKLRRAIGNIAANARDVMGPGGHLHLHGRLLAGNDGAPEQLEIEVADEGPGIPDEIRDRLFEPFVTKGKKQGTGLGLAVARRFVEDHEGTLRLLPDGPGARFLLRLPLPGSDAAARKPREAKDP